LSKQQTALAEAFTKPTTVGDGRIGGIASLNMGAMDEARRIASNIAPQTESPANTPGRRFFLHRPLGVQLIISP
jgi:hypothetical protein